MSRSQVRIIAGDWRGRKIPVPDLEGLRPTPDRIRETLFNWLANDCRGARVLDCFAGSGALGFEAASRGAKMVTLVEFNKTAFKNLQKQNAIFQTDRIELLHGDVCEQIGRLQQPFDIVFVDPPYAMAELRRQVLMALIDNKCLNPGGLIYLEWPDTEFFELPLNELTWFKQKKAGHVNYAIAEWRGSR